MDIIITAITGFYRNWLGEWSKILRNPPPDTMSKFEFWHWIVYGTSLLICALAFIWAFRKKRIAFLNKLSTFIFGIVLLGWAIDIIQLACAQAFTIIWVSVIWLILVFLLSFILSVYLNIAHDKKTEKLVLEQLRREAYDQELAERVAEMKQQKKESQEQADRQRKEQEKAEREFQEKVQKEASEKPSQTNFFNQCFDENSLKRRYYLLMKAYHPDSGNGDSQMAQLINAQYEEAVKNLRE